MGTSFLSRISRYLRQNPRRAVLWVVFLGLSAFVMFHRPEMRNLGSEAVPRTGFRWRTYYLKLNQAAAENPDARVVFIGDTFVEDWKEEGAGVWQRYYAHRKPLNLGIDRDCTEHVLWRIENGNVDGLRPEVFVVMAGSYNTHVFDRPWQIAGGTKSILEVLSRRFPESKILLVSILPRGLPSHEDRTTVAESNRRIADLKIVKENHRVYYLDLWDLYLDENEIPRWDLMPNALDLSTGGYLVWAQAMEPTLARLLGDRQVSAASPPSGPLPIVGY